MDLLLSAVGIRMSRGFVPESEAPVGRPQNICQTSRAQAIKERTRVTLSWFEFELEPLLVV